MQPADSIDLTYESDGDTSAPNKTQSPLKRKREADDEAESPSKKAAPQGASQAQQQPPAAAVDGDPTENRRTQQMSATAKALQKMPERAQRNLTIFSTEHGVTLKDPEKFSIKPPFWERWQPHDYINLAEHLRVQFDPIPFCRASSKPVEEVNLVASRLVFNPLYKAAEAMKRHEDAIKKMLAMFREHGTCSRPWSDGKFKGELDMIAGGGLLRIIQDDGSLKILLPHELTTVDTKYLDKTLSKGDWMLFFGKDEASHDEMSKGKKQDSQKQDSQKQDSQKSDTYSGSSEKKAESQDKTINSKKQKGDQSAADTSDARKKDDQQAEDLETEDENNDRIGKEVASLAEQLSDEEINEDDD